MSLSNISMFGKVLPFCFTLAAYSGDDPRLRRLPPDVITGSSQKMIQSPFHRRFAIPSCCTAARMILFFNVSISYRTRFKYVLHEALLYFDLTGCPGNAPGRDPRRRRCDRAAARQMARRIRRFLASSLYGNHSSSRIISTDSGLLLLASNEHEYAAHSPTRPPTRG